MSLREGCVIEFKDKKRIASVLCLKVDAKNVRVINDSNKEFNLPVNKISHITDHILSVNKSRVDLIQDLNNVINRIEDQVNDINLSDLWELLKDESEDSKYDLKQLSEIYFGSDANTDSRSSMLRAIIEDSIYFDIKSDGFFVPKSEKIVEQIIQQKKLEEQRLKLRENVINWIKSIWSQAENIEKPDGADKFIDLLKEIAVLGDRSERYHDGSGLLLEAGINQGNIEENAISLLTKLGIFEEDENLLILEHNVHLNFSKTIMTELDHLNTDISEEASKRTDLRDLYTITIDDEDTKDIDDAISFHEIENGFEIGIHIADAANFVRHDTLLDKEAQGKSTTIYLAERKIEMLPYRLSEDVCSLVANQDRLAVSLLVSFDHNNEMVNYKVVESVINVNKRMSYTEADSMITNDNMLMKLGHITSYLRQIRLNRGAIIFNMPELKIKITDDKKVVISKYKQNSPSQAIISELMVFANSLIAEYTYKNKIPCIYRYQDEPSEVIDFNSDINPIILMYKQRRFMKKSETSTVANEHHGLGLNSYTQMTSPIRRYSDLVVHRQLKSYLRTGEPFYSEEKIKEVINFSEHSIYIANLIQRTSNRYWVCKFLSNYIGCKTPALVLDVVDERYQVQLSDYLIELPLFKELGVKLEIGQEIEVIIKDVQTRRGFIAIKLLKEPNEDVKSIEV